MKRETGFTLLEVLIAVLVLSIGLLGLAALQTTILRSSHSANLRTQATLLAYDMTDRMRANPGDGVTGGLDDYVTAAPGDYDCVWDGSSADDCKPPKMAQNDVFEWNAAIARDLPQGMGVVCYDSTPNDGVGDVDADGTLEAAETSCDGTLRSFAVKLWWVDEFDAAGNPVIKRFSTAVQP